MKKYSIICRYVLWTKGLAIASIGEEVQAFFVTPVVDFGEYGCDWQFFEIIANSAFFGLERAQFWDKDKAYAARLHLLHGADVRCWEVSQYVFPSISIFVKRENYCHSLKWKMLGMKEWRKARKNLRAFRDRYFNDGDCAVFIDYTGVYVLP